MTPRSKLFLMAAGFIFFGIALADLLIFNPKVYNNWFSYLHWYGKASVVMFAVILLVLVIGQFNRKK